MAIVIRGTPGTGTDATQQNGANKTITLPGDIASGDRIYLFGGHSARAGFTPGPVTATGWNTIAVHTSATPYFGAWYKDMGSTPDSSIACLGTGDAADACAYGCYVLGGSAAAFTYAENGPTTGANPVPPQISGAVSGLDLVIAVAFGTVFDSSIGAGLGYTLGIHACGNDSGEDVTLGSKHLLAGTFSNPEVPGAFPTWASSTYRGITLLIKPASGGRLLGGRIINGGLTLGRLVA